VLPAVLAAAPALAEAVVLVKPQFESGREHVPRTNWRSAGSRSACARWVGRSWGPSHRPSPAPRATGSSCSTLGGANGAGGVGSRPDPLHLDPWPALPSFANRTGRS
jgi:hypothetical protein